MHSPVPSRASRVSPPHPLVVLASSHGGHLELLETLMPAFADVPHAWLTAPGDQADALRRRGERVLLVPNPQRAPGLLARNAAGALRALRALRPRLVISTGANVAVPFCLLARARGVPLIFAETMARVERGSLSGRLLAPHARTVLVQWPELRRTYPRAEVCRPALLEGIPAQPASGGRGTFVAAGTHGQPFDRLVAMVETAMDAGLLPEPVVVQAPTSRASRGAAEVVPRLPAEELRRRIAGAEVVISHGGAGILSLALRSGRMPIVLARRRAHREHVDDHQVGMVAALQRRGLVVSLEGRTMREAVAAARDSWPHDPEGAFEGPPLRARLAELIAETLA